MYRLFAGYLNCLRLEEGLSLNYINKIPSSFTPDDEIRLHSFMCKSKRSGLLFSYFVIFFIVLTRIKMPLKLQGRVEVCLIAPGPFNLRLLLLKQVFRIGAWQFPNNFYPGEFVKNICYAKLLQNSFNFPAYLSEYSRYSSNRNLWHPRVFTLK